MEAFSFSTANNPSKNAPKQRFVNHFYIEQLLLNNNVYVINDEIQGDIMPFVLNKITLVSISFLSIFLIIIGFLLQVIFIPLQDFDSIGQEELLAFQKEYAINYPLGNGLFYIGLFLLIVVMILLIIKITSLRRNK